MASGHQPGQLIGAGRSADVYALDQGRVLRRYRSDHDVRPEALVMTHLAQAGFPVPRVDHAEGLDLVMERLDGTDMLADLGSRPWRARRHARTLARLHDRLHEIDAPPGLPGLFGPGNRALHLSRTGRAPLARSGKALLARSGRALLSRSGKAPLARSGGAALTRSAAGTHGFCTAGPCVTLE